MKYREGYKYQLWEDESLYLPDITLNDGTVLIAPRGYNIDTQFARLTPDGAMTAKSGFAYDGPSGPTYDSRYCMRGTLFHDLPYDLMRQGRLPLSFRPYFDALMYVIIRTDGFKMVESWGHMAPIQAIEKMLIKKRAWTWYQAVCALAESSALPKNDRPILEVPSWGISCAG